MGDSINVLHHVIANCYWHVPSGLGFNGLDVDLYIHGNGAEAFDDSLEALNGDF